MVRFRKSSDLLVDNISIQGYSHKLNRKECQDTSISWKEKGYCGIIVCDGHGGEKYIRSASGSKFACEVGKEKISEFMESIRKSSHKLDDNLDRLESAIVSEWLEKVKEDISKKPIDMDERFSKLEDKDQVALLKNPIKAYGSTFIAAVMAKNESFVLKLGDGNVVLFYDDATTEMPEELLDEELQFNVTTSLCNSDAALCFHHCYRENSETKKLLGITVTSDGVINCYHTEKGYISFMKNVFSAYGEETVKAAKEELTEALGQLSEKGSGDDLSIAIARILPAQPMAQPESVSEDGKEMVSNSPKTVNDTTVESGSHDEEMQKYDDFILKYKKEISIDPVE